MRAFVSSPSRHRSLRGVVAASLLVFGLTSPGFGQAPTTSPAPEPAPTVAPAPAPTVAPVPPPGSAVAPTRAPAAQPATARPTPPPRTPKQGDLCVQDDKSDIHKELQVSAHPAGPELIPVGYFLPAGGPVEIGLNT